MRTLQVLEHAVIIVRGLERMTDEQPHWIMLRNAAHLAGSSHDRGPILIHIAAEVACARHRQVEGRAETGGVPDVVQNEAHLEGK